jgi:hypothetical protein
MKKIIAIVIIAGGISLGFAAVKDTPVRKLSTQFTNPEKTDFSHKLDEKRLAYWD